MAIALSVAYTATPLAAGAKVACFSTGPVSPGVSFVSASRYRLLQVSAAAAASPANVLATYNAKFGALVAGQKIFFKTVVYNADGLASDSTETSVVVS